MDPLTTPHPGLDYLFLPSERLECLSSGTQVAAVAAAVCVCEDFWA